MAPARVLGMGHRWLGMEELLMHETFFYPFCHLWWWWTGLQKRTLCVPRRFCQKSMYGSSPLLDYLGWELGSCDFSLECGFRFVFTRKLCLCSFVTNSNSAVFAVVTGCGRREAGHWMLLPLHSHKMAFHDLALYVRKETSPTGAVLETPAHNILWNIIPQCIPKYVARMPLEWKAVVSLWFVYQNHVAEMSKIYVSIVYTAHD